VAEAGGITVCSFTGKDLSGSETSWLLFLSLAACNGRPQDRRAHETDAARKRNERLGQKLQVILNLTESPIKNPRGPCSLTFNSITLI